MTIRFKVHKGNYPYFITSTITYWINVFCRNDYFRILVDSLNYCAKNKGLLVHAYVLMPNHFHMACSQVDGHLPNVVRDLKRHTSTVIAEKLAEDGRTMWLRAFKNAAEREDSVQIWVHDYHPEQIKSEDFYLNKVRYMHENPIKAGFVSDPSHWQYSSAGFYYHDAESPIQITPLEW